MTLSEQVAAAIHAELERQTPYEEGAVYDRDGADYRGAIDVEALAQAVLTALGNSIRVDFTACPPPGTMAAKPPS